jgi:hypothetical protein
MLHRIAHWFGWQHGFVVSAYDRYGVLWMAFRCAKCGRLSHPGPNALFGRHPSLAEMPEPREFRQ